MASQMAHRRARRVADQIQREIARAIQHELKDPRVGMVNVTGVDVTDDLSLARIHYSLLGDDSPEARKRTIKGLRAAGGFLRSQLKVLGIRHIPELQFHYDTSGARAAHMHQLLASLSAGGTIVLDPGDDDAGDDDSDDDLDDDSDDDLDDDSDDDEAEE